MSISSKAGGEQEEEKEELRIRRGTWRRIWWRTMRTRRTRRTNRRKRRRSCGWCRRSRGPRGRRRWIETSLNGFSYLILD
jgi:hypothetical protein